MSNNKKMVNSKENLKNIEKKIDSLKEQILIIKLLVTGIIVIIATLVISFVLLVPHP